MHVGSNACWFECMLVSMHVGSNVRWFECMLFQMYVGLNACWLVCMLVQMYVGLNACWFKCMLVWNFECMLVSMHVGSNVCWFECMLVQMHVGLNACWFERMCTFLCGPTSNIRRQIVQFVTHFEVFYLFFISFQKHFTYVRKFKNNKPRICEKQLEVFDQRCMYTLQNSSEIIFNQLSIATIHKLPILRAPFSIWQKFFDNYFSKSQL